MARIAALAALPLALGFAPAAAGPVQAASASAAPILATLAATAVQESPVAAAPAGAPAPAAAAGALPADRSRGLWIGPIHACRDTVRESALDESGAGGPFPTLMVTLRPDLRAQLQRETERLVDRPMPIRLDGRVIAEPIVREPITGGVLALSGSSEEEAEAMQQAIRRPC